MKSFFHCTAAALFVLLPIVGASAASETVLYAFKGGPTDGASPYAGVVLGTRGKLYGTTQQGGSCAGFSTGCGTVFGLTPPKVGQTRWTEAILYQFKGGSDGRYPSGTLAVDKDGVLYGTTSYGGNHCPKVASGGCGTVFKLTPPVPGKTVWTETVLRRFAGGQDGANPFAGLTFDSKGALYGTTVSRGAVTACTVGFGCGTVFKLTPPAPGRSNWTETILHRFTGAADGRAPYARLTADGGGGFYGTTSDGGKGSNTAGGGAAFQLKPPAAGKTTWTLSVVHYLGGRPSSAPIADSNGILYGVQPTGGGSFSYGEVYRLAPPAPGGRYWAFNDLHSFTEPNQNGSNPSGELILDASGNLYGTTGSGGRGGGGTVFKLTKPLGNAAWTMTKLHSFCAASNTCADGATPSGLVMDSTGALYGTAQLGGTGNGVVFKVVP